MRFFCPLLLLYFLSLGVIMQECEECSSFINLKYALSSPFSFALHSPLLHPLRQRKKKNIEWKWAIESSNLENGGGQQALELMGVDGFGVNGRVTALWFIIKIGLECLPSWGLSPHCDSVTESIEHSSSFLFTSIKHVKIGLHWHIAHRVKVKWVHKEREGRKKQLLVKKLDKHQCNHEFMSFTTLHFKAQNSNWHQVPNAFWLLLTEVKAQHGEHEAVACSRQYNRAKANSTPKMSREME